MKSGLGAVIRFIISKSNSGFWSRLTIVALRTISAVMKIDIDRPSTWKLYRSGMCEGCFAGCCTMPVEVKLSDLIRLGVTNIDEAEASVKKLAKRLIREGLVSSYRSGTDLFMLVQKKGRDCVFLDEKRRCTVYDRRPDVCRQFPSIGPRPGHCPCQKI